MQNPCKSSNMRIIQCYKLQLAVSAIISSRDRRHDALNNALFQRHKSRFLTCSSPAPAAADTASVVSGGSCTYWNKATRQARQDSVPLTQSFSIHQFGCCIFVALIRWHLQPTLIHSPSPMFQLVRAQKRLTLN